MQDSDFCRNCGKTVEPTGRFCEFCSRQNTMTAPLLSEESVTKPNINPTLLSLVLSFILIIVLMLYLMTSTADVVKHQLMTLKHENTNQASYTFTSQEFQSSTSLEHFKEFMNEPSTISKNKNSHFSQQKAEQNESVMINQEKRKML